MSGGVEGVSVGCCGLFGLGWGPREQSILLRLHCAQGTKPLVCFGSQHLRLLARHCVQAVATFMAFGISRSSSESSLASLLN